MIRVQLHKKYLYYDDHLLTVSKIIIHPNYYKPLKGANIALLKLSEPVKMSSSVRTVSLPPASETFPSGTFCLVTGWGNIDNGGMW